MSQICIADGEACVDCAEYAAAFSCLPKIKISGMPQLSKLDTISILDTKCEDILLPITSTSCETGSESHSLSLKDLLDIIGHTSVGERESFPDKEFTAEGQLEEYELTVFNPHETRDMQCSYFANWSAFLGSSKIGETQLESKIFVDDVFFDNGSGDEVTQSFHQNDVFINSDASIFTFFATKIIKPKSYTKIKMNIECLQLVNDENSIAKTEGVQLMITGVTK